jgi:hypothetical protein
LRTSRKPKTHAAFLAILLTVACQDSVTGPPSNRLRPGTWAGDSAGLVVSENGATASFHCGRGEIRQALRVDAEGRFDVAGIYFHEAGPASFPVPARFVGRVDGDKMILEVQGQDSSRIRDPVRLQFGRSFDGSACV